MAHIATMAYHVFPQSLTREAPFYLMFGCNANMPTLFKLLLPILRYMGDEQCRTNLDTMQDIYMMAILNLKTTRDKFPPPS